MGLADGSQQEAGRMSDETNLEIDTVADAAEATVVADNIEVVQVRAADQIVVRLPNVVSDFVSKVHSHYTFQTVLLQEN